MERKESSEVRLEKIFCEIKCKPSSDLVLHVCQDIVICQKKDSRIKRIKLGLFSILGFLSLASLVPVLRMLSSDLAQSGFWEYLSVGFGNGSLFYYWKETTLSILESLPMTSIIMSLCLVFIFFF